jgi:two-component system, response regulator / RNA-binding antiterminator
VRPRLVQNFRGVRAAILHGRDRNREVIVEILAKLGLSVLPIDPCGAVAEPAALEGAELILFDADAENGELLPWPPGTAPVPLIAVIGLETPSRLQRAFDQMPAAVLYKPVRPAGIYTALFFATNEHRRRQSLLEQLGSLEARHGARRFVVKALLAVMERHGLDDEQAYRLLRKESMRQRVTVEELAVRLLAAADTSPTARKA